MTQENKDASEGCLFLITLILSLGGLYSIVEGSYFIALLYCAPLICWMLYIFIDYKSLKGDDKIMAMASFSLATIFFTIAGIISIIFEDFFKAFLLFIPLICCFLYGVYYWIAIVPKEKRWNAVRRMYDLPYSLVKEDGDQWGKEFQQLINAEINNVSELEKKNDLQQCQHIVKKMIKDESFENLHRAFRFTGCHLIVTDNDGKPITKIV